MMNLNKILSMLKPVDTIINNSLEFEKPEFDSRKVAKNDIFVAIVGNITDGHNFIGKAIEQGAAIIVCETMPIEISAKVSYILVNSSSQALGVIASEFFGNP
jgi:UDP-N-acetylmuramoyl-L-alanyl-D-glutamate--2,6-diaminopimelate ligase